MPALCVRGGLQKGVGKTKVMAEIYCPDTTRAWTVKKEPSSLEMDWAI